MRRWPPSTTFPFTSSLSVSSLTAHPLEKRLLSVSRRTCCSFCLPAYPSLGWQRSCHSWDYHLWKRAERNSGPASAQGPGRPLASKWKLFFWLSVFSFRPTGHVGVSLNRQVISVILEGDRESSFQLAKVHNSSFFKNNIVLFTLLSFPLRTLSSLAQTALSLLLLFLFVYLVWFWVIVASKKAISINTLMPSWEDSLLTPPL